MEIEGFHTQEDIDNIRRQSQTYDDGSEMPSWHDHFLTMWDIIKQAEKVVDDDDMLHYHMLIKKQHKDYVRAINSWLAKKQPVVLMQPLLAEDRAAKEKALSLKGKYEEGLCRYFLCYMYLNRLLVKARIDINATLKVLPPSRLDKSIRLGDNMSFLLTRAYREKCELNEKRQALKGMRSWVNKLEPALHEMEEYAKDYFPRTEAQRFSTRIRGYLRLKSFKNARQLAEVYLNEHKPKMMCLTSSKVRQKIVESLDKVITIMEQNLPHLNDHTNLVLDTRELRLKRSFVRSSEVRVEKFISKYGAPFLGYKYKLLLKQAYRLAQIGTFEKLFYCYDKLLKGLIQAQNSEADVQTYEAEVLKPASYTIKAGISNIPDIFDQMEATMHDLRTLTTLMRNAHDKDHVPPGA